MNFVDNNQYEVKPVNSKRKIAVPTTNVYLNPGLDLLVNEDPICNTVMEVVPIKKRKRTRSCGDVAAFDNSALDLGISKAAINELLITELENVKKNIRHINNNPHVIESKINEPIYANITEANVPPSILFKDNRNNIEVSVANNGMDSGLEQSLIKSVLVNKSLLNDDIEALSPITNIQTNVTNQVFINNSTNSNLSFIDKLALDSPDVSNQCLYYDDDLNESNIMEIKTITIITKKKRIKNNTNPFLEPNIVTNMDTDISTPNPFINLDSTQKELEYNDEVINRPLQLSNPVSIALQPCKLFGDTNSTISTLNESEDKQYEYENIDRYRSESPIYENIDDANDFNKQSRILGHDVSHFNTVDIMNLNKIIPQDCSCDSNESKKSKKHFLKVGNKLSKKVFKTLKKTFKGEKFDNNMTLNPYEVPRKSSKLKEFPSKESGIENLALNLDNSDEIEIEEIEDEHEYETVKTLRNTHLNMNITPLKERSDNSDISHNKTATPEKKVRFDSTLNQEKVITGTSFDCDIQSPGFDVEIDKYHDELENCINERKFLQQNM